MVKGWKKTGKYSYRHIKTNNFLHIGHGNNMYIVQVQKPKQELVRKNYRALHSLGEARKFAVNYMKEHPKG